MKHKLVQFLLTGVFLSLVSVLAITAQSLNNQTSPERWLPFRRGQTPRGFVAAYENNQQFYLCRAKYQGGVHPGKIVNNICHITYGGRVLLLDDAEIVEGLTGEWKPFSAPDLPKAYVAGSESGLPVYLCQARYENRGIHPGKVVNGKCNIGWGVNEIPIAVFDVFIQKSVPLQSESKPTTYKDYIDGGNRYFAAQKYDEAIREFTEAIKLNSTDSLAYINRGISYARKFAANTANSNLGNSLQSYGLKLQNENAELALRDLTKAIELNPKNHYAFFARAELYSKYHEPEKVIADAQEGLRLKPDYSEGQKFYNGFKTRYSTMLMLEAGNSIQAVANSKDEAKKQAVYDQAFKQYARALELDPQDSFAYANRANLHETLEKYDLAVADYSKAIQLNPNEDAFYVRRGYIYGKQKKFDLAIADYSKIITIMEAANKPASVITIRYAERAGMHLDNNKLDLALGDLEKALRVSPDSATALYYRGLVHLRKNQKQAAIEDFKRALKSNPLYIGAHEELTKLGVKP